MKIVFICQAVDQNEPIQSTGMRWIEALAKRAQVEQVTVIALRKGKFSLPENVQVRSIKAGNRLIAILNFYREIFKAIIHKEADCFFVYQGGPYPVLLLPFKLLLGKPIYQWKAHPSVNLLARFCARFCDTKVFTSTQNAFPLKYAKVKVVGQGVDIEMFREKSVAKTGDLITVGRIAPVKQLHSMIEALVHCKKRHGKKYRLDIYGPTFEKDRKYKADLEDLIIKLDVGGSVSLHEAVYQNELPDLLNRYRAFLNFSRTALDRSVVEAMACGLPVISTNPCVEEVIPEALRPCLIAPETDLDEQAKRMHSILSLDENQRMEIGKALRETVEQHHSIEALFDKILAEMDGL